MADKDKKELKIEDLEVQELEDEDLDDVAGGATDVSNKGCPTTLNRGC